MNKFVPIPDHIRGCTNAEDVVSFLQTLEINQKIQLRTKFKSLDENWTDCIAVRERNSWSMKFQGEEESSLVSATNYDDGDEENSLISADNWMIGWYSFHPSSAEIVSNVPRDIPITGGDFELGGEQFVLPCRRSLSAEQSTIVDFRLYSKVFQSGDAFLTTKDLVRIASNTHIFFLCSCACYR